ncbi:reverse transcriptase [Gossypium australe]|uniref:Reverse transcriptase n=1 Tax=Gossypium australe TaxID=47621 RepID=A0A5B6WU82_9ROSI|nr:reverse transcriptase [Gossypium australe]
MGNPATVREFKQLLVANAPDIVFLSETKININSITRVSSLCRMEGCLVVRSEGKSGGLAMMWKEGTKVSIQSYSKFHVDSLVGMDEGKELRFTGFYGHSNLGLRKQACDMLRSIKSRTKEGWMIGGDFKDILNEAEKDGGRRKPKTTMREFNEFVEELSLVNIKTSTGWFTWSNNREGSRLVKERLDRFLVSEDVVEKMLFMETKVVRQSKSDHDAILMNTEGNKPRERGTYQKQCFRYDMCWAKEKEVIDIINRIWSKTDRSFIDKAAEIKDKLGPWQFKRLKDLRKKISDLDRSISRLMDNPSNPNTSRLLKDARGKLGYLFDVREKDLGREFTDDEILRAFNQMDLRKAPGIDGLPGSFYKEHWVIYKIISKVFANRLKVILPMCISKHQSAFVPGRMIHDNVLIAHELIHYLRSPKNGPNKGCVVKLDMSKAYDRERGLRQGDPLSPYLFLFCMDALSRMLLDAQVNSKMKGIRESSEGPHINHLFFADDALLFVRNNRNEVEECMRILDRFEKMSGQQINVDKSMVYFSPKTLTLHCVVANEIFRMKVVDNLDSYLGLPIPVGKKRPLPLKSSEQGVLEPFVPSQRHGGLGFRDLHLFNVAMLRQQVWRLLLAKTPFVMRSLRPNIFLMETSFTLRILRINLSLGKASPRLLVYLARVSTGMLVDRRLVPENYVSKLMDENRAEWNEERVTILFGDYLKDLICKFPISHAGHDDQRVWFHNPCGFYTAKSTYSWLLLKQISFGPRRIFWRLIWKLKTLLKIKTFCWRLGQEILPTYDKIASIRSGFNSSCPRCGKERESHIHALRYCPFAKAVLEQGGLGARFYG